MKNHFANHIKTDFDGDNNENILFEMMALCISDGTRIIIDNSSHDMERVRAMDRYTDVWMPHIRTLRQKLTEAGADAWELAPQLTLDGLDAILRHNTHN